MLLLLMSTVARAADFSFLGTGTTRSTRAFAILRSELIDQLGQGRQLVVYDERKLLYKIDKMFEAGVEMCFFAQLHHLVKVLVINVCVHPKQSLKNCFGDRNKIPRKGYT